MLGMLRFAGLEASGKDPVQCYFCSPCQQYGVTNSEGPSPQGRTEAPRHGERRAGLDGPSGLPSFQPIVPACDWSSEKTGGRSKFGVDPFGAYVFSTRYVESMIMM